MIVQVIRHMCDFLLKFDSNLPISYHNLTGGFMTYKGVKIPKCNGRPQLWARAHSPIINYVEPYLEFLLLADGAYSHTSLRIIYPSGNVSYHSVFNTHEEDWCPYGCTSADTQLKAIKNTIDYDAFNGKPWFLGYL